MVTLIFLKIGQMFQYLYGRDRQTRAHAHHDDIKIYILEIFSFLKGKRQAILSSTKVYFTVAIKLTVPFIYVKYSNIN
jgi:hypothetical protein